VIWLPHSPRRTQRDQRRSTTTYGIYDDRAGRRSRTTRSRTEASSVTPPSLQNSYDKCTRRKSSSPAISRIVRRATTGFGHLEAAVRTRPYCREPGDHTGEAVPPPPLLHEENGSTLRGAQWRPPRPDSDIVRLSRVGGPRSTAATWQSDQKPNSPTPTVLLPLQSQAGGGRS